MVQLVEQGMKKKIVIEENMKQALEQHTKVNLWFMLARSKSSARYLG